MEGESYDVKVEDTLENRYLVLKVPHPEEKGFTYTVRAREDPKGTGFYRFGGVDKKVLDVIDLEKIISECEKEGLKVNCILVDLEVEPITV